MTNKTFYSQINDRFLDKIELEKILDEKDLKSLKEILDFPVLNTVKLASLFEKDETKKA